MTRHIQNWSGIDHPWRRIKRTLPERLEAQSTPESRAYKSYVDMCERLEQKPLEMPNWQRANGQAPFHLIPMDWGRHLSR